MRPFSLTVALLVALGACHTAPTEPAEVGSLSIDPSTATVPMSGTLHLSITARDINGRGIGNPAVTFQTSAPLTATVDNAGVVSGLMVGPVTISATSGQRTATASIQVSPRPAAALGLGTNFACALTETGAAYCWGKNDEGQLGDGTTASTSVPVPVAGGVTFSAIAVGTSSACGLIVSGAVNCWGNNDFGALGNGTRVGSRVPVPSAGQLLFESLSGGGGSYCGLTADAVPYCWGNTYSGQLGNSIPSWSLVPVQVQTGGAAFRSISSGLLHACGLTSTGLAYCWGGNTFSQLGDGTSISRSTPAPVGGGLLFTSIDPGASTTCGIATGIAYCWGSDFFGSLGQGTTAFRPDIKLPAPLVGGTSFVAVRAGPGNNIFTPGCGISTTGAAYCWGANSNGQLGTTATPDTCSAFNMTFGCSGTPLPVSGGHKFLVVVPAAEHTCGITDLHALLCWGLNADGQLGDGTTENRNAPVAVLGGLRTP